MLCASNHITVSRKLMFLAWSLLICMLDSTPRHLTTGALHRNGAGRNGGDFFCCIFFLTTVEMIMLVLLIIMFQKRVCNGEL